MKYFRALQIIVLIASAALLIASCGKSAAKLECFELRPVDDPMRLPYRFEVYASQTFITNTGGGGTGDLVPVTLDSSGALGCYLIGHNWMPEAGYTSLLLYRKVEFTNALTHLNIRTPFISSHRALDFDHDGQPEVAIAYTTADTLWLDIKDFNADPATIYHRMLATGSDRNDDGHWDGRGFVCATYDFTGDGYDEIVAACDVGYDLYPRLIFCVDWHQDTILWRNEVSGIIGDGNVEICKLRPGEQPDVIATVSSKGNAAVAGEMTDEHSYLLAFDAQGTRRWYKMTGDEFHGGQVEVFDANDDGLPEILSAQAFDQEPTTDAEHPPRWGSLLLYDAAGKTLDSIGLGLDRTALDLQLVDLDGDGLTEVAASLEDGTIIIYDRHLNPLKEMQLYTKAMIWGVEDYLGRGDRQILLYSYDRKLWLLDQQCEPLAQLPVVADRARSTIFKRPEAERFELVLSVDGRNKISLVSLASTSWALIFYRKPWLAFLLAFVPLSLLLLVLIVWIRTWRRKNLLLAEARTQDAAYQAHKSLIAGIAHRLRNSMSLAVMNTQTLRHRYREVLDEKARGFLFQIEQSLQNTSDNIAALSKYERIEDEKGYNQVNPVAIAALVRDAYRPFSERIGARVEIEYEETSWLTANPTHIKLLFDTLIKNGLEAVEGMSNAELKIEIRETESRVEIRYRDNGPGLAPEVAKVIGTEVVSTKPTNGLGIGVLSLFEVVQVYGGQIKYRNCTAGGLEVVIFFPKVRPT